MQLSEYNLLVDLIELAPVVGVMGLVIFFLWKDNRAHSKYIHEMDKDNLETLKDLSNLLENLVVATDRNKTELESKISHEAGSTRNHVDKRVELLEERIKAKRI